MRAIRRWLGQVRAERGIAPRRASVRRALEAHFARPVALEPSGARGRDSIYRVTGGATILGWLRLVNPHRRRAPPAATLPYRWLDDGERLDREWHAYARASPAGLAPAPLWRADDALVCAHVAGARFHALYRDAPDDFWSLNAAACRGLARLHALGLVHTDASLANVIAAPSPAHPCFVDFEYAPAAGLPPAAQALYDHLRLVESAIKTWPEARDAEAGPWLEALDATLPDDARGADPAPLRPALTRLWDRPALMARLARIVPGLGG